MGRREATAREHVRDVVEEWDGLFGLEGTLGDTLVLDCVDEHGSCEGDHLDGR